jgi:tRNA(Ile)-lysidine synthase
MVAEHVREFVEAHDGFPGTGPLVLAVSGGADSTALLHVMADLKSTGLLQADLLCVHVNHQLRGSQSDLDQEFVVAQSKKLGLEIVVKKADVRKVSENEKISIETAARQLRIELLLDIAKEVGAAWIATGHHMDDNAETVLHRLLRGTGIRGLCGVWPERVFAEGISFARPLLKVTRKQILAYLNSKHLSWREDATNADCIYKRNFIRHRLQPALQAECTAPLAESLNQLSEKARLFYLKVNQHADEIWPEVAHEKKGRVILDIQKLLSSTKWVQVELIRRAIVKAGSGERDLRQEHFEAVLKLAKNAHGGKYIELPDGFEAANEYGKLIFTKALKEDGLTSQSKQINIPGETKFADQLIEAKILDRADCCLEEFKRKKNRFIEWFDLDKINGSLQIRRRREGDRFVPLGQTCEKKIGKFLTDEKVPKSKRKKILVISDENKIIWLCPIRASEETKVKEATENILELTFRGDRDDQ